MENQKYDAKNKLGFGIYHLDPRWDSFENFNEMADRGYLNAFTITMDSFGTTEAALIKAAEIGAQVWLIAPEYYSAKETLDEYLAKIRKFTDKIKEKGLWENVVGFHWDEPLLHPPHTNQDLYDMTRALTEEYGIRMFPVFSAQEVMGRKGNWNDPDGTLILEEFATEYLTDIGYDSYGYDYRIPSTQTMENKLKSVNQTIPEITSTETYYRHYFDTLKKRCLNKKARIWVFPCTYRTYTWAGIHSDEDYCIAHLKGLTDLLLEQEYPGGILGYTYKSWSHASVGLDLFLDKNNPDRWTRFEEAMRETYNKIKDIEIK